MRVENVVWCRGVRDVSEEQKRKLKGKKQGIVYGDMEKKIEGGFIGELETKHDHVERLRCFVE